MGGGRDLFYSKKLVGFAINRRYDSLLRRGSKDRFFTLDFVMKSMCVSSPKGTLCVLQPIGLKNSGGNFIEYFVFISLGAVL